MPPVTPSKIFATPEFCPLNDPPAVRLAALLTNTGRSRYLPKTQRNAREARLRSTPPEMLAFRAYAKRSALALRVAVLELALGDLLEGHGEVVLRTRLDQRRREVVEGALAELVVIVVD